MTLSNKANKKSFLKDKKILLATWACGDKDIYQGRDWIPLFERMFGKLIIFPFRNYYYLYGRKELNARFLETIREEKPDYLLFGHRYNEIEISTIKKIKEISPQTKTIIEHGDDDWKFDDWGRYYSLFFDYVITTKINTSIYERENLHDAVFLHGIEPNFYKPLNVEKEYDVTFIGSPIANRYEYIKFLKEKGINIKLFGVGWQKYSDLKDIYGGMLYSGDFPKVINQSRINLNFSKTFYEKGESGQLKSRIFEVPACSAFLLNEYTDMNIKFINNKKEINFRNKKELLEKIDYYLKHKEEREKIAKEVYNHVVKYYSWEFLFSNFFRKIDKDRSKPQRKLPEINKKIIKISHDELNKPIEEIEKIVKDTDYIFFDEDNFSSLSEREYLQAYSLSISKKQISCCDYYVHSGLLGDYLIFKSKNAFNTLGGEFYRLLNISQLMSTKEYFLKNLDFFKSLCFGKINVNEEKNKIENEDIVFVSIPLVRVKKHPTTEYNKIKDNFYTLFLDNFSPLIYQKKFFNPYIFKFFLFSLMGNFYMIKSLLNVFSVNIKYTLKSFGLAK